MQTAFCLLLLCVLGDPIDHDLQYVSALRMQSYFRLSHLQGERLLAKQDLTAEQRAQVVVEISKTFAAQALNSRPPTREEFWHSAAQVLHDEVQRQSDIAARVLIQVQLAFVQSQQAEWTVREGEIRSQTDEDWNVARSQLRQAIKSLRQAEQELASPTVRQQSSLTEDQQQELKRNIQYELANAYLHQAIAYGQHARDRTNALTQAMELFAAIAMERVEDALVWKSRIGRVRCVRMLAQFAEAQKLLKRFSNAPENFIGAVAAESIRLALDARSLESAMELAANENIQASDPEFQLARIQAFLAAAEQLKGQPKAKSFQQKATQIAANLAKEHGVYWSMRSEILLSRLALDQHADASLLGSAAETMLRQDSPASAKQMFQRAAEQAREQGGQSGDQQAFEFLYKAAVVDHREERLQPAIDQFRSVALKYPQHPQAPEAHLLAVFDAAALFQEYAAAKAATMDRSLAQYENLLNEHTQEWPASPTADQARIWAAKLAIAQRKWQTAIALYQAVATGSKFETEAYQGLQEVYARWIPSRAIPEEIQTQRAWLQRRLQSDLLGDAQADLAILAADVAMSYEPRDYALAESVLRTVPTDTKATSATGHRLNLLRVLAAMANGRSNEARALFAKLLPLPRESLLTLIRGIAPIREQRRDDADLRIWTLEVVGLLKPYHDQIDAMDRLVVNMAIADYLPTAEAVSRYQQFAHENPRDYSIQLRLAELVSSLGDRDSRLLALDQWRNVVRLSEKRSPDWFRAKLGVAQAHYRLGERENANELIEYLGALYPDFGGRELKAQFQELQRITSD